MAGGHLGFCSEGHTGLRRPARVLLLCCVLLLLCLRAAQADTAAATLPCPGKPRCVQLAVDGTVESIPPIFRAAVTNSSVNEIVLAGSRYVLRPSSWTLYTQQQPYRLARNLTIRGHKPTAVLDFSLIEKKVLIAAGVQLTFEDIILANVKKLGGFGIDFFMGEAGSLMRASDVIRIKPACQLAADVLRSAQSFTRHSPAYPPNAVHLIPKVCFTAALTSPDPQQHCFTDALTFDSFSLLAAYNDPDKGSQYPGYVLFQENTTRVCQAVVSRECLEQSNGDEELCMAMLIATSGIGTAPNKASSSGGSFGWSPGTAAAVAVAGGIVLLICLLLCLLRRKLRQVLCGKRRQKKHVTDPEMGYRPVDEVYSMDGIPSYTGVNRAISQQVTLNTLLGAGSFGRVYKGRWHSSDVAIKIINVRTPEELPKVLREAEVMMVLDHPNIVRAFHASVWNPAEQIKAMRDARNSSGRGGFSAAPGPARAAAAEPVAPAAAAVPANGNAHAHTRNPPRRNASSLRRANAGADSSSQSLPALQGPTGKNVSTPSITSNPTQQQMCTSSTIRNSTGSTGHSAENSHGLGLSSTVATGGAAAGQDSSDLTGWLQIVPEPCLDRQQQPQHQPPPLQQQGGHRVRAARPSADCAPSMLADGADQACQHSAQGLAGAGAGPAAAAHRRLAVSSSDGLLDTSGQLASFPEGKAVQQQQQHSGGGSSGGQQPQLPQGQQQQQQQQHGGLRRHLLLGWRNRSSGATADGNSSLSGSPALSPTAAAAAAAPPAVYSQRSSGSQGSRGHNSGASAGAGAAAAGLSSAGAVAIMHAADLAAPVGRGSKASCTNSAASNTGGTREQEQEKVKTEQQVWIILELCTGGTLLDAAIAGRFKVPQGAAAAAAVAAAAVAAAAQVERVPDKMEIAKLLSRLLDAATGMSYLHSRGVMHGDLKAGNVLLQHSIHGAYGQVAKISDFGLSAVLLNDTTHRSTASLGTITHMAPELLRNGRMSPSADVYSFGILMWETYCGKQAWQGLHYGVVVERVVIQGERPPVPEDMPEELELLMRRCWDTEPANRPSFDQIVECLELLLDNLGSETADSVSTSSDQISQQPRCATAPAAPADHGLEQQQQRDQAAGAQLDRQSGPAGFPGPAAAGAAAGQAAVVPQAPAGLPAHAPPAAAPVAAAPMSAHASPATPVNAMALWKQQAGQYDSSLTPSGGLLVGSNGGDAAGAQPSHASIGHSSGSIPRSSTSGNPGSSQLAPHGASGRRPSVLDENVYLQDL